MTPPTVLLVTLSLDDLRALVREAVRAELVERAPASGTSTLRDRRELAHHLGVSPATVTRLTAEGCPCTYVGDSPRYDIGAVCAWLAERGRRGTKAGPSKHERIPGVRLLSRARRMGT
jgi:hypothetical protein